MLIDPEQGYRAVVSRDARFDGQFFLAVRPTGLYCRPSCPSIAPRRRNAEFFATAAAAQQAGYRACRRCLPDIVPGSPEWDVRGDLAGRAMRLIIDGVVEREGVPGLARRVGYSERHLTRVLTAELGAGPLALARAHRAHTARLLIETTTMSVADVAIASGFASVRQFNDTIRAVFATTPSELRVAAQRAGRLRQHAGPGRVRLRLPVRTPFDAAGILAFLGARAIPGVESTRPGRYSRTLRLPHGSATAHLRPAGTHVECTLRLADLRDLSTAVSRLRRLFDLDADPGVIDAVLAADPALTAAVAATPGIRVPGSVDGTETVVRALLGQQVSVSAARTAARKLTEAVGEELPTPEGELTTLFPSAAAVAERASEILTGPARRVETIRAVCAGIASGDIELHVGVDAETLRSRLQSYPGIGPWTAGYVVMRLLGDPDVLLPQDLALRNGARALGLPSSTEALAEHGRSWRPWRSYAGMHLWRAAAAGITL
ncbi:AlkA N-terminal domain-containing protein [Actinokineospora auranticolor]|uniref:DNA-3-methyladenine glycosylase II n=1 Tax=Actinokineospora auranticolor TaxID=155976 RepID=A0A2S6GYH4_9PSEU|nr:AlkA N-terminal domain-containing protein [Actinokineospora auranticolor]PPK70211.1 AraC family transcriptional regulator of adaptative response / DNA-3-methyladenine glycosylase II [Actinokineospora auranticolor]